MKRTMWFSQQMENTEIGIETHSNKHYSLVTNRIDVVQMLSKLHKISLSGV